MFETNPGKKTRSISPFPKTWYATWTSPLLAYRVDGSTKVPHIRRGADKPHHTLFGFTCRCPLLAQSRHSELHCTCLLLGVKRTCRCAPHMSAFDPKRTSGVAKC